MDDHYPSWYPVQIRFRDLDPLAHVNNTVYFTYFEEARSCDLPLNKLRVEPFQALRINRLDTLSHFWRKKVIRYKRASVLLSVSDYEGGNGDRSGVSGDRSIPQVGFIVLSSPWSGYSFCRTRSAIQRS